MTATESFLTTIAHPAPGIGHVLRHVRNPAASGDAEAGIHHPPPHRTKPPFGDAGAITAATAFRDARATAMAGGPVMWPWPPGILIDHPDIDIETYLVAAMHYIKGLAASSMPRCEQDRTSLETLSGLVENGLRLVRARRQAPMT